ncbi:hypothetical protein LCGC14_1446370 [marine sediment metagenome]|uniref:Uncharacterized protein n=1 Tax=marine sediment metagenome TaxID=412755 RepID=A0A0F9JJ39_9ZZZZ
MTYVRTKVEKPIQVKCKKCKKCGSENVDFHGESMEPLKTGSNRRNVNKYYWCNDCDEFFKLTSKAGEYTTEIVDIDKECREADTCVYGDRKADYVVCRQCNHSVNADSNKRDRYKENI